MRPLSCLPFPSGVLWMLQLDSVELVKSLSMLRGLRAQSNSVVLVFTSLAKVFWITGRKTGTRGTQWGMRKVSRASFTKTGTRRVGIVT